ncbi:MAG: amidohydrolase family protein [Armatimonadetes bacterium]|nr:amidohydrolase family protein [Armatimonadota bacterium]
MLIDIHTHSLLLHDPRQRKISRWTSPEELLSMWDALGIERGVVLPLVHHEIGAILQTSENALDIYNLYPDRIIPFCNLDPRWCYNHAGADFTPVLEHYKELGCKGFGEFTCNLWWDDDRVLNLLSHVERAGLPLLFHVASLERGQYGLIDDHRLSKLELVLQRFPRLQFIGHSMGFWSNISGDADESNWMGYPTGPVTPGGRTPELMRRYDNLWADISAGSGNNGIVRDKEFGYRFLEEFQDRVLFGTDICGPGQEVEQVDTLNEALAMGLLSQAGYDRIAHLNAEKLLGL